MNILIIGGNGFIGSHLVDIFLKNDHKVRVFDSSYERYREILRNVDYRISSLNNTSELAEALLDIDIVFHLASSSLPVTSNFDPSIDVNRNLLPTIQLLNTMLKLGKSRIVYFSSGGTVYGRMEDLPIKETESLNPISSYGIIKVTIENYLKLYEKLYGLKAIIIRPSNPYGPRQGHYMAQGVISTFLYRIKENSNLIVFGDGTATKDYIYISDLIEAIYKLCMQVESGIFNIGSGIGTSLNDLIKIIKEVTKKEIKIEYIQQKDYDVQKFVLDVNKIKSKINWEPRINLFDGITKEWEWFNNGC